MIAIWQMPEPPRHILLGAWGYEVVLVDRRKRGKQIEGVRDLGVSAD